MSDESPNLIDLTYTLHSNSSYSISPSGVWTFNLQAKLPTGPTYQFFDAVNISKPGQNAIAIYMKRVGDDGTPLTWLSGQVTITVPTVRPRTGSTPLSNNLPKTLIILVHESATTEADIAKLHDNVEEIYQKIGLTGPYNSFLDDMASLKGLDRIDLPKKAGMTLINKGF